MKKNGSEAIEIDADTQRALLLLTSAHINFLYAILSRLDGLTEMLTLLLLTPAHLHFLYTILSSAPQRRKISHVF